MAILIDGKAVAAKIKTDAAKKVENLNKAGIIPGLAVIMVGDDPASKIYLRNKKRACEETGVYSEEYVLPQHVSQQDVLDLISRLNQKTDIHGILVQLPLPKGLDETAVVEAINPQKDVDGFHAYNAGKLVQGRPCLQPCTPAGIIELIRSTGTEIEGKHCVVVGRSNIVGKPTALLLLRYNGTVSICHSKTKDLAAVTRQADILVCAVGKPRFITAEMIKPGSIVIDVGMNRGDGKLCGDVDFDGAEPLASYITPVPGGVGPMTIAMLMKNTVTAALLQNGMSF